MTGTEFIHCCQQWNWGKSCWAQSWTSLVNPPIQIYFISSLKQIRALNKTTWMVLAAKAYLGAWPSRETGANGGNHSLQRQGKENKTPAYLCFNSNLVHLENWRREKVMVSFLHHSTKLWLDKHLSLFCFSRWATGPSFPPLSGPQAPLGNLMPSQAEHLCWKRLRVAVLSASQGLNQCERSQDVGPCDLGIINQSF